MAALMISITNFANVAASNDTAAPLDAESDSALSTAAAYSIRIVEFFLAYFVAFLVHVTAASLVALIVYRCAGGLWARFQAGKYDWHKSEAACIVLASVSFLYFWTMLFLVCEAHVSPWEAAEIAGLWIWTLITAIVVLGSVGYCIITGIFTGFRQLGERRAPTVADGGPQYERAPGRAYGLDDHLE